MCSFEYGSSLAESSSARETLINAAIAVFSERKLSQVTMGDVAARAGMSKANVYNYFRDKDQLFLEAHRRFVMARLHELAEEIRLLPDMPAKIIQFAKEIQAAADHPLRRLPPELCERALSDPDLREDLQHARAQAHEWMRAHLVEPHGLSGHASLDLGGPVFITFIVMFYPFALMFEPELRQPALLARFIEHMVQSCDSQAPK